MSSSWFFSSGRRTCQSIDFHDSKSDEIFSPKALSKRFSTVHFPGTLNKQRLIKTQIVLMLPTLSFAKGGIKLGRSFLRKSFNLSLLFSTMSSKGGKIIRSTDKIGLKQMFDNESSTYTYLLWDTGKICKVGFKFTFHQCLIFTHLCLSCLSKIPRIAFSSIQWTFKSTVTLQLSRNWDLTLYMESIRVSL